MNKIDLVYLNLVSLLTELTIDNPSFENYYDLLAEEKQDKLIDLSEKISIEKTELINAHGNKEFFTDFTNLISFLDEFKTFFDDFSNFRKNELYAIISVIQKLTAEYSGDENFNFDEEIALDDFEIIEVNNNINKDNFYHFDLASELDSLLLFNISHKEDFKTFIDSISAGTNILFYLLGKLGRDNLPLGNVKHILVRKEYIAKPKIVFATLSLHIIKSGEIIHTSFEYNFPPKISANSVISLGKNYQQFNDSIAIISEYNYQKDILDKYLRIYHVLENFMYKSPLVRLEKDSAGQVFSIRDFKRMYDRVNDSEIVMLKKLFDEILKLPYTPIQTFKEKVFGDWTSLVPAYFVDDIKINSLIDILKIYKNNGDNANYLYVSSDNIPAFLSKLVYAYRNSMVHNRETEFHLTHMTLMHHNLIDDTAKTMLEKFLLPTLEEIVFNLIINENDIVWYDNSILKLWEEN